MKSRSSSFIAFFTPSLLVFLLLLPSPLQLTQQAEFDLVRERNILLLQDDFSKEPSSSWRLLNATYWDPEARYVVLTKPGGERVGIIWLKMNVTSPFTAEFRYRVGGGSGADGFVFMFYKYGDYEPGIGGYLGFLCRPVERPCPRDDAPGYGVEFDNYLNSREAYGMGDPSPDHIALIKDHVNNHLAYVNDSRTEDNIWHRVKAVVREQDIDLFVDGGRTLTWRGQIDRSSGRIGFGSGIWGQDHWHIIDDFKIYGNTIIIRGLKPGWTVDLYIDGGLIDKGVVPSGSTEVAFDVSGRDMPLKGYFKIYSQPDLLVLESRTFNEIWGGDVWSLRDTTFESTPNVVKDSWPIYTAAILGVIVVAVVIILRARSTSRA